MLILDFETRSRLDLIKYGSALYASDLSTEIICCSVAHTDHDEVWTFRNPALYSGPDTPRWVLDSLVSDDLVAAHNAPFDRDIYDYVAVPDHNFPPVAPERWYCTAAMCRVNALPGRLENAIRAITRDMRKDFRGSQLIRKLSIPRGDGTFNEDPVLLEQMAEYCEQDIAVTKRLIQECRPLTQSEHRDWRVSEAINARGIRIDTQLAADAVTYAEAERGEIAQQLRHLTNGRIERHTQTRRVCTFVREQFELAGISDAPLVRYKDGEKKYSIDKAVRAELLDRAGELSIPEHVIDVIELTDDGNRSSVAKFQKMLDRADPIDQRVRGAFIYAGAQQTLRFSSRGVQAHNMRRDCWDTIATNKLAAKMHAGDDIDNVMDTLSKLLRPTLVPAPGHVFVCGDWSAVEAMALPWLADSAGGKRVLEVFRSGGDIYMKTAADLNLPDRQIGKVGVLSLGFGGAVGAFQAMARNYGVKLDDHQVKILVRRWREANSWAPDFWSALNRAARRAITRPGTEQWAGRVCYQFVSHLLDGTLLATLPGDVMIQYPQARIEQLDDREGTDITCLKGSWTAKADATEWPRTILWHGVLAENPTQAVCGGYLRHALARLEHEDGPGDVVMHTHDEIVLEVPEARAYAACERLAEVMCTPPPWAAEVPLKAVPEIRHRYGH